MARTGKTTLGQDDVRTLGQDDVRTLGRPGDVSIKSRHGQVMDKKKLESARVGILDLDKRLARLEDAGSGRFGSVPKDERNVERNVERKDQGNEDKKDEISAKFAGGEETSREKPGKPGSDFGSDSGTGKLVPALIPALEMVPALISTLVSEVRMITERGKTGLNCRSWRKRICPARRKRVCPAQWTSSLSRLPLACRMKVL